MSNVYVCTPRAHVPNDGYSCHFFNPKTFIIKMGKLEDKAREMAKSLNDDENYEQNYIKALTILQLAEGFLKFIRSLIGPKNE